MRTKTLGMMVTVAFLLTYVAGTTTVSAYDGRVIDRLVVTEHTVTDWVEVIPGFMWVKGDVLSHVNLMMLETNDPLVVRLIGHSVEHGETGLRVIDPITGMVNETSSVINTAQTRVVGTINLLVGSEDAIEFSRTIGSISITTDGVEVLEARINALSIIKFVDGEIQWTKTWIFVDHEKVPIP